jgi:hypothetical protein
VYKILKQINKDIKETVKIQENIVEIVCLQYCEKLWNTTNINEPILEWNSYNYIDTLIISAELKKALKLTKNVKSPGEDGINSELYKYAPEEFKLRLLQVLHTIYKKKLYSKCVEKCHCNPNI